MKHILILFAAILLLAGCSSFSNVTFHTQPPGGMVTVDGVLEKIADGGTIELEEGEYTLLSEKKGFAGVEQQLVVDGENDLIITVPLGSGNSQVTINTFPEGEQVLVQETGQIVRDGETISLPPGSYSFLISKKGYHDNIVSQQIDGLAGLDITVPLGQGFGVLNVSAKPAGSLVRIDETEAVATPFNREISSGSHEITIERRGYFSQKKELTIKPGSKNNLNITLKKIPTSVEVTVKTDPAGGRIYFENKEVGQGSAGLGTLAFGAYRVHGEKMLNTLSRLVGKTTFDVKKAKARTVVLSLDQKQSLFEQQWMPEKEAKRREEKRYQKQRAGKTVSLTVALSEDALQVLSEQKELAKKLHTFLRVGDRVNFITGGREIVVWKRSAQITPAFQLEVSEVLGQGKSVFQWRPEKSEVNETFNAGKTVLADIAFILHSTRNSIPLCDLSRAQLTGNGEEIFRTVADGELFLVMAGGTELSVNGQDVSTQGAVFVQRIAPANSSIKLSWKKVPARVLLVSDQMTSLKQPVPAQLMMQEKKLTVIGR